MNHLSKLLAGGVAALALISTASSQPAPAASADALFAAGDFAGAERAYEAAAKAAPDDSAAQVGLARMRLYENRNDEAIALAQKVLAAQPGNPGARQVLSVAQERKSVFGPDRYQMAAAPPAEAVIPFVSTDPLPVVRVKLGDREALFLIDTGGADLSLAPDLATELGLEGQVVGEGVFAGGIRAPIRRTLVPHFQIGPIKIDNVPANIGRGAPPVPGKVEGIIGTKVLMHFLSTLDYCQGRLVLRPRSASAAFEQAAARDKANVVPMWLISDHMMFARANLLHGTEGIFLIDTGLAGGGLMAPKASLDEAGVKVDPNDTRTGMGGGGQVTFIPFKAGATLGALTVDDVAGSYTPGGDFLENGGLPFKAKGLLSHGFFRHSRLTFDFDAMKIVTQACAATS
jgi:tetratricopeptide (TPR) repeat protein